MRKGLGESKLLKSPVMEWEFSGVVVKDQASQMEFPEGEAVYAYTG